MNEEADALIKQAQGEPAPPQPPQDPPTNPPPQGESPPQPAPAAPVEGSPDYWKNRFEVMQGKYNAEVPRLAEQVQSLTGRVTEFERVRDVKPFEKPKLITEDEAKEYSPEFIDMVERAAEQRVAGIVEPLKAQITDLQRQVGGVAGETRRFTFGEHLAKLDSTFPAKQQGEAQQWRLVNESADFLNWLAERDIVSGRIRNDLLQEANQALDTERVAAIFRQFIGGDGKAPPAAPPAASLNAQVLPPAATTGPTNPANAPKGRMWKNSEIQGFYDDIRRGKYRDRLDEQKRTEQDIFAAQGEGRVIANA